LTRCTRNEGHDIVISVDNDRSGIVRGSGRHVKFGNLPSGRFCYSFSEIGAPSGRFCYSFSEIGAPSGRFSL